MIYLDAAATVPTSEDVQRRVSEVLTNSWGNVSGGHAISRNAKDTLELAREKTAQLFKVQPDNIVFTSGATEALNIVLQGYLKSLPDARTFCSSLEHDAVFNTCKAVEKSGKEVTYIKADSDGDLDLTVLDELQADDLVCVMAVNNEIGIINNLNTVSTITKAKGAKLLVDAVQSFYSFLPEQVTALADYVAFSGHKIGAPQGVGALVIKDRKSIEPLSYGGAQEWEIRPGTTPAYLCDAFSYVWENELATRDSSIKKVKESKKVLVDSLNTNVENISIHAANANTSDHIVSVHFEDVESQMMLTMLDSKGICVSKGSACASGASQPSHVLLGLGMDEAKAKSTIRFSFSRNTNVDEVKQAAEIVAECVKQLRGYSS